MCPQPYGSGYQINVTATVKLRRADTTEALEQYCDSGIRLFHSSVLDQAHYLWVWVLMDLT